MDKEIMEQLQALMAMMENMATKDDLKGMATKDDLEGFATKDDLKGFATKDDIDALRKEMREEIRESETRTKVFVENNVTKRIDSLFDGYKLTQEKQYEMDRDLNRKTDEMQEQIDQIQARVTALETSMA